jgi:hypothetical protein
MHVCFKRHAVVDQAKPLHHMKLVRVGRAVMIDVGLVVNSDGVHDKRRIAYNFSKTWALAAEHYADFGPIGHILPGRDQSHQLYGVVDYSGEPFDVEAGIGFELTGASDHLTLKLMLSRDLNKFSPDR